MEQKKVIKKLREMAIEVSKNAHAPYSNFHVGSAILTRAGNFFAGCNVENSSYGGTVCAERIAIFKGVTEESGAIKIDKIYVYTKQGWSPCGMCRQVIAEFADEKTEVIMGDEAGKEEVIPFGQLLPLAFTSEDLK